MSWPSNISYGLTASQHLSTLFLTPTSAGLSAVVALLLSVEALRSALDDSLDADG